MTAELTASPGTVEGRKEALVKNIKGVVGDADGLSKEVANSTSQGYAAARTEVKGKLGEARS